MAWIHGISFLRNLLRENCQFINVMLNDTIQKQGHSLLKLFPGQTWKYNRNTFSITNNDSLKGPLVETYLAILFVTPLFWNDMTFRAQTLRAKLRWRIARIVFCSGIKQDLSLTDTSALQERIIIGNPTYENEEQVSDCCVFNSLKYSSKMTPSCVTTGKTKKSWKFYKASRISK